MSVRFLAIAFMCTALSAQPKIKIDESAKTTLRDYAAAVSQRDFASCSFNLHINVLQGAQKIDEKARYRFALSAPNKLHLERLSGRGVTLISDGNQVHAYVPDLAQVRTSPAPASIQELMLADPIVSSFSGGATAFLWMLTDIEDATSFLSDVTWMVDMGSETIDDQPYQRIYFQKRNVDMNVWIDTATMTLRRIAPDLSKLIPTNGAEINMALDFSDWQTTPFDGVFQFKAPEHAESVSQFNLQRSAEQKPVLVGKAAPLFELDKLDGSSAKLADHKKKDIVVLDFWATWCGPCRMTMPQISQLAQQYKDKNVHVYALNLKEPKNKVAAFVEKLALDLDVILDTDGTVGQAYGAQQIPQTIIIDREGIVQAVHVGFSQNLKEQVSADLDTLLAGETLVD